MTDRKKVRIMLPNGICYHGEILSENDKFIVILDKFKREVQLNKSYIISLEVV